LYLSVGDDELSSGGVAAIVIAVISFIIIIAIVVALVVIALYLKSEFVQISLNFQSYIITYFAAATVQ